MSTLTAEFRPIAKSVFFSADAMRVVLADDRELVVPLRYFPRLQKATASARKKWELIGGGIGIHWPLIDEDISVENLLSPHPASGRRK